MTFKECYDFAKFLVHVGLSYNSDDKKCYGCIDLHGYIEDQNWQTYSFTDKLKSDVQCENTGSIVNFKASEDYVIKKYKSRLASS